MTDEPPQADKPVISGSLSQDDKEKIVQWVNQKMEGTVGIICSICHNKTWTIGDDLVVPPVFKGGDTHIGGRVYPQAMLICNKCAHTIFINAVRIGLMESGTAEEKSDG